MEVFSSRDMDFCQLITISRQKLVIKISRFWLLLFLFLAVMTKTIDRRIDGYLKIGKYQCFRRIANKLKVKCEICKQNIYATRKTMLESHINCRNHISMAEII